MTFRVFSYGQKNLEKNQLFSVMENEHDPYNDGRTFKYISYPGDTNLLLGLYTSILETDNRLALPDEIHEDYKEGLYITRGFDRNIMALTMEAFESIYDRITTFNLADPVARLLLRMILSTAQRAEIEPDGRVPIPESLKAFANLERDVTIVGQGDFVELWSPNAWKIQEEQLLNVEPNHFSTLHITTQ
jgi:MraZ protein